MLTFYKIQKFYEFEAMKMLIELIDYNIIYVAEVTLSFRLNIYIDEVW